jgi:hypothetical protein
MNENDQTHVRTAIAFDEAASLLWRQRLSLKERAGSKERRQSGPKLATAFIETTKEIHRKS